MLKKDQKQIIQQLVQESMTFSRKPNADKNKTSQNTQRSQQTPVPTVSFKDILQGLQETEKPAEVPVPSFHSLASIAFEK